jgi:hypothetical protein
MVHWTQHLPLFTVFHWMAENKSKVKLPAATIKAGVQAIYTQSDVLAQVAFDYLPVDVRCLFYFLIGSDDAFTATHH